MAKKKLITSALPYVNNAPHLGNIIGCVLSGDVFARFCRSRGYETLYICGTDGYGTATETKAKQEGKSPEEICEQYHKVHKQIYRNFNIAFDEFGKTFSPAHKQIVQSIYGKVKDAGYLIEKESDQTFCEQCDSFLADRFVEGTCPHCNYAHGRGDQCESCGKLLNPTDLIKPRCSTCQKQPTVRKTRHLYLDLTKISDHLKQWQDSSHQQGQWTSNARTTTQSWMKLGLQPRPITRDLKWGVSVPERGFENKVFYVWFDAPLGYISITKNAFPETWQDWWLDPESTELYQFMAKDNIPFHSVIFPATLIASQQPWTKVHHLNSTEYLNYENTKFSKSKNIGVFGTDVAKMPFPIDFWRFYLVRIRPEKQDSNFSWIDFGEKINSELIDNIANLINRVLVFFKRNFNRPVQNFSWKQDELHFCKEIKTAIASTTQNLEAGNLRDALLQVIHLGKIGNRFFQEQEPWKKIKSDKDQVERILTLLLYVVKDIAVTLEPFLPETAQKIQSWFPQAEMSWNSCGDFHSLEGIQPRLPEILFQKIDPKQLKAFQFEFQGKNSTEIDRVDIRVGEIIKVEVHPDAKNLFIVEIDIGERRLTVVSNLVKYYQIKDLMARKVLVINNLEPAIFKGVTSEGMVLVAAKGKKLELLTSDALIGTRILPQGNILPSMETKVTDLKTFQNLNLEINEQHLRWRHKNLFAGEIPIKTTSLIKGSVK